jgi:hypothetical protein
MSFTVVPWVFLAATSWGFRLNPARFPAEAVFLTSNAPPLLVLRLRLSLTSPDRILTFVVNWRRDVQPSLESQLLPPQR